MGNGHSILFFFFWLGHDLGLGLGPNLAGLNGAREVGLSLGKKMCLVNGPGPSHRSSPARLGPGMEKPDSNLTHCLYVKSIY